jgi:hypothetical protein
MAVALGTRNTFAATLRESEMIDAIGGQKAVVGTAYALFETERMTSEVRELIRVQNIQYIVTDIRMTRELPDEGHYFDLDPLADHYARPLPAGVITKYNGLAGVSRIFDDGDIAIYDVREYDS